MASDKTTKSVHMDTDQLFDEGQECEISYDLVLHNFMEVMLEGDSADIARGASRPCPECLSEDAIPADKKFKVYKNKYDLQRHLESIYHAPIKKWLRRVTALQKKDDEGLARCDCGRTYAHVNKFQDHLEKVLHKDIQKDDPHFDQMTADGWLLPDFKASRRSPINEKRMQSERQRERIELGRDRPRFVELTERQPSTTVPGAYCGPEDPASVRRLNIFMERTKHLPEVTNEEMRARARADGFEGLFVEFVSVEDLMKEDGTAYIAKAMRAFEEAGMDTSRVEWITIADVMKRPWPADAIQRSDGQPPAKKSRKK